MKPVKGYSSSSSTHQRWLVHQHYVTLCKLSRLKLINSCSRTLVWMVMPLVNPTRGRNFVYQHKAGIRRFGTSISLALMRANSCRSTIKV
jgi:hypothetical protein